MPGVHPDSLFKINCGVYGLREAPRRQKERYVLFPLVRNQRRKLRNYFGYFSESGRNTTNVALWQHPLWQLGGV